MRSIIKDIRLINSAKSKESFINCFNLIHNAIGDVAYLVDDKNRICAISQSFQEKFSIPDPKILLSCTFAEQNFPKLSMYRNCYPMLEEQNTELLISGKKKIFIDVTYNEEAAVVFVVHKTPIYLSNSNKIIFIHVRMLPLVFARLANIADKIFNINILPKNIQNIKSPKLTAKQKAVIYLYLRNYSYVEISNWMTAAGLTISASRVIEHLNRIKEIIGAKDKAELRSFSIKLGYDLGLPLGFIPEGSYDITSDLCDLWIC